MSSCLVRPYTPNNWVHVAPLVKDWPFKPMARHDRLSASKLLALTCERVQATLGNEDDGTALVALQQGQARGFTCFTALPWDSEQLGMRTARIDYLVADGPYDEQRQIKEMLLEQLLIEAHESGVWHLSVRVDASDLSSLHVLEEAGFITVDGVLTFALDQATQRPVAPLHDFKIRLATAADADRAAGLARTAFVYDRFHADPFISHDLANNLHANWLRNSCAGPAADAVLLAEDELGLLGFVTCVLPQDAAWKQGRKVGTIGLVASAEHARGRGVAYATTIAALEWFWQQGCEIVEVGTQLRNIPAAQLYQKCGFRLVGSAISLRRLV